jgi:hypothetical protein
MTSEILMAVSINIAVGWYVTFNPEDVGSKFLRNVGTYQTIHGFTSQKTVISIRPRYCYPLFRNFPHRLRLPQFSLKCCYQSL